MLAFSQKIEPYDAFRVETSEGAFDLFVGSLGTAQLPSGHVVLLAGRTPEEAGREIERFLHERLRLVAIENPAAPVRYFGAVRRAGETMFRRGLELGAILGLAQPTDLANLEAVEVRRLGEVLRLRAVDPAAKHFRLRPGDRIFVPSLSGGSQIYVLGGVVRPGSYPFQRDLTVREAVRLAGGVSAEGDSSRVEIRREDKLFGVLDVQIGNAPLRSGDVVHVVRRSDPKYIYVIGGVFRPNRYPLDPQMTLLQAVQAAGGVRPELRSASIRLIRTENGKETVSVHSLVEMLAGKEVNPFLKPGDRIELPEVRRG